MKNLVPSRSASVFPILSNPPLSTCSSYAPHKSSCRTIDLDHSLLHVQLVERPEFLESFAKIGRAPTNKDCGSFFFVRRSPNTLTPAFFPSPLTAKLTAKPVDNSGFPWMEVETRLACGAAGRRCATLLISLPPLNSLSCRKRHRLSTKSEAKKRRFCGLYPHIIAVSSKRRYKLATSCRLL